MGLFALLALLLLPRCILVVTHHLYSPPPNPFTSLLAPCTHQVVSNFPDKLREFVDQYCAQYALLGLQFMWTVDVEAALEGVKARKGPSVMKDLVAKTSGILSTLSSWCLQDLGSSMNRYGGSAVTALTCSAVTLLLLALLSIALPSPLFSHGLVLALHCSVTHWLPATRVAVMACMVTPKSLSRSACVCTL